MPTVDYICQRCRYGFQRIFLRGEKVVPVECPQCKAPDAKPAQGPTSLFDGIAPFSSLTRDTN